MTTMPTPDQAAVQQQLGPVLQAVQPLWDNPNPTAQQKGAVRLMVIALSMADPSQADKLEAVFNTLAALEAGDDKATALRVFLREMLAGSSEYELCKYILGDDTGMPSWPNVAAKLTEIAMRDAEQNAAQSTPTQTQQPAPAPTQPAPTPNPAQVFANLNGGAPWQAAPTAAPTQPQPTPQPAAAPTSTPQPTPPQTHQPTPQPPNPGPGAVKQRRRGGVKQQ